MAVYRLVSSHALMSVQYAQSLDVHVRNLGERSFEALLEVSSPSGIIYQGLCGIQPYAATGLSHWFLNVGTACAPFELKVITNTLAKVAAVVEVHVKHNGQVVAVFTQEHFEIL